MYNDIGKKIKTFAKVQFVIEAIAAIIVAIILWVDGPRASEVIGWIVFFVGPVFAWISSWVLYGFGELIDKTCDIKKILNGEKIEEEPKEKEPKEKVSGFDPEWLKDSSDESEKTK